MIYEKPFRKTWRKIEMDMKIYLETSEFNFDNEIPELVYAQQFHFSSESIYSHRPFPSRLKKNQHYILDYETLEVQKKIFHVSKDSSCISVACALSL